MRSFTKKYIDRLFCLLVFLAYSGQARAQNWEIQRVGRSFNDLSFVSTTQGWIVGNGGAIMTTSNGGATWSSQNSGTTQTLNSVHFASATHGWAVGNSGVIVATTDGGVT